MFCFVLFFQLRAHNQVKNSINLFWDSFMDNLFDFFFLSKFWFISIGEPGIDYPAYSVIPKTNFNCSEQRYKGFFGDPDSSCQVWHYCDLNGGQSSFLCPNGTIFSQVWELFIQCNCNHKQILTTNILTGFTYVWLVV